MKMNNPATVDPNNNENRHGQWKTISIGALFTIIGASAAILALCVFREESPGPIQIILILAAVVFLFLGVGILATLNGDPQLEQTIARINQVLDESVATGYWQRMPENMEVGVDRWRIIDGMILDGFANGIETRQPHDHYRVYEARPTRKYILTAGRMVPGEFFVVEFEGNIDLPTFSMAGLLSQGKLSTGAFPPAPPRATQYVVKDPWKKPWIIHTSTPELAGYIVSSGLLATAGSMTAGRAMSLACDGTRIAVVGGAEVITDFLPSRLDLLQKTVQVFTDPQWQQRAIPPQRDGQPTNTATRPR